MSRVVAVVCSDRGEHGVLELGRLRRTADGLAPVAVRRAPSPPGSAVVDPADGHTVRLGPLPVAAPPTRDDHDGRSRFRWRCPVCRRDVQLVEATARALVDGLIAAGLDRLDVSALGAVDVGSVASQAAADARSAAQRPPTLARTRRVPPGHRPGRSLVPGADLMINNASPADPAVTP